MMHFDQVQQTNLWPSIVELKLFQKTVNMGAVAKSDAS